MRNGERLTVVSWNLQGRSLEELDLVDAFAAWQPDIALLQEADGAALSRSLAAEYRTQLWWPTVGTSPGIALLSRLAVRDQGVLGMAVPAGHRQRGAWAVLQAPDGASLTVACVHLLAPVAGWPPTARRRRDAQRALVTTWAAARMAAGERVVIGGDFNTREPRLAGLVDATRSAGRTWRLFALRRAPPMLRIDAVFVGPGVEPAGARVERDRWVSDHLPLVVTLRLSAG